MYDDLDNAEASLGDTLFQFNYIVCLFHCFYFWQWRNRGGLVPSVSVVGICCPIGNVMMLTFLATFLFENSWGRFSVS